MTLGFLEKQFNMNYFAANVQLFNYQLFKVILTPVKKLKVCSIKINIRLFLLFEYYFLFFSSVVPILPNIKHKVTKNDRDDKK